MPMKVRYTVLRGELIEERRNGVRRTYVPDPLGSIVALVNDAGTVSDTFSYWPFGEVKARTGSTPTQFQFVGSLGYFANSTNIYVRSRFLRTSIGSWLSRDPLQDSPHAYNYCYNSPVSISDPSGLTPNYECQCASATRQKEIAAAFTRICSSKTVQDAFDACIGQYCHESVDGSCLSKFCTSKNKDKLIVKCPEGSGKLYAWYNRGVLYLYGPTWIHASHAGGLDCIILHELLHYCGHGHKRDSSSSIPQSYQEDCYCSNCTSQYNPNCKSFALNGKLHGWSDCANFCP